MKCSFCEQELICKACRQRFRPRTPEIHTAVYQPDMQISCPECQQRLVCRSCGFVYGNLKEEEDE